MIGAFLKHTFRPKPLQEIDDELAFHLEQATQQRIDAGVPAQEARRQAILELGAMEAARAQSHEQRPTHRIETVWQDILFSVRVFRRNRLFTLTAVVTLMLGLGATTAVFSVVDPILFRSLPYGNAAQLVSVGLEAPIEPQEFMLSGSYYQWQDSQQPFTALTSETGVSPCDLTEERPSRLHCGHVEGNFLSTLAVTPVVGRNFSAAEDTPNGPKVAILSNALWRTRYAGNPAVVGMLAHLDGQSYEIVGVLPAQFEMPRLQQADVLLPQALDVAAQRRANPGRPMWAFARLKPGVSIAQARMQLQPLFDYSLKEAPPQFRKEVHLQIRSLRDRQMQDVRTAAWMLFGLVLAVLLIACANLASLTLARATQRLREVAVRASLGASRGRLVQQSLTESLLLGGAGMLAGLAFAWALLHAFRAAAPAGMLFLSRASLDGRIFLFALAMALLSALTFGAAAAFRVPSLHLLASRLPATVDQARLRRWLVVAQLAASMVLLVGGGLLARSFHRLQGQNLGFSADNVVTLSISLGRKSYPTTITEQAFYSQVERNLSYGPGIESLAITDSLPPGGEHHD